MNFLDKYIFWFCVTLFYSILFFILGLYFLSIDYYLFLDWDIFNVNSCSLVMTFLFDWMSLMFAGSVMFISSMIIYYSYTYMFDDMYKSRFLFLVLFFVISMMLMIMSPNLVSILLGWDGLGLISYCLVIYFQNFKSYNAGMLTILTNRIGDVCILLGIGWLFNLGTWHFFYYNFYCGDWGFMFCILMILGGFTKSAQIPFSSWLPAAMAAPTPVSALVHSSTLVTAGVYLLIRFNYLLSQYNLTFFLLLSALTMFMSGLGANFEYDLKSIIALSTLSQLGFMMSILFIGYSTVAYFHLLTHAFFKALLFLCAGLIIHCVNNSQDIRYMGGLVNQLPYTGVCFAIANFSLCGLPFLSGFYSKDMVLEILTTSYFNFFIYLLFFLSIGLTVSYSFRLMYFIMLESKSFTSISVFYEDKIMNKSMIFFVILGVSGGSILSWLLFPFSQLLLMPIECKLMPLLFIILGGAIGYELSFMVLFSLPLGIQSPLLINFLSSMWFMPFFSTYMIYSHSLFVSKYYYDFMDMGWGEYIMSNIMSTYMIFFSKFILFYQNNNIKIFFYSFILMMFILIII
uniref:NADH-ubiquinone oxidoreductase chain 5 n=1 Tax=Planusocoris schaeferi TaxID=2924051 RepID=A0A8T9EH45_9HEMI|nr:NADH dehydrogenase subunit 5 [Planusocoris schaeferi]UNA71168.1 NADH dehydrogenase subunit 5 [Planusocoris schaeferi]